MGDLPMPLRNKGVTEILDEERKGLHPVIAGLVQDRVSLNLSTIDICFLTALYCGAEEKSLVSFADDFLLDLYEQVGNVAETGAMNLRLIAGRSIQRLREQRLLARVDTAGAAKAGDYSLTQLARGLVQYYMEDEALTRESLNLLMGTIIGVTAEVLRETKAAQDPEELTSVLGPLRVTVGALVDAIDRRQRGLDAQQERIKTEIADLLAKEWGAAVDRCLALLEETTATLGELSELLMRECGKLTALLIDIEETAMIAGQADAAKIPNEVLLEIDRIAEWGSVRFRDWTSYYQWTQRYLREIVHIDQDRKLSRRLRDCLNSWPENRYRLVCARAPAMVRLREVRPLGSNVRVGRPRVSHESQLENTESREISIDIEAAVRRFLVAKEVVPLSELTADIIAEFPGEKAFPLAGRVAAIAGKETSVFKEREPQWSPVGQGIEVEEALLEGREL